MSGVRHTESGAKGGYAALSASDEADGSSEMQSLTGGSEPGAQEDEEAARLQRNLPPAPTLPQAVKQVSGLAYPMAISSFLDGLTRQITVMMVGHLGPTQLGAATLGAMTCNVTGFSLCFGGMSSLDTLASQAFGAKNFRLVGTWAQRGALMLSILAVPITCVWCFATDDVLHALGVGDDETIALAVSFTRWSVFGFWPTLASRVLQGFLRAQRIVKPVMYCSSFAGLVTASISWLFVLQFGFIGAPLAQAFGAWFNLLLTLWYVRHKGLHEKCWGGWDSDCLHGWGTMARLGSAGMMSTMGQWWSWEICAGCAGVLGKIPLAAHSCITNIGFFCESKPQAPSFLPLSVSLPRTPHTPLLLQTSRCHSPWASRRQSASATC